MMPSSRPSTPTVRTTRYTVNATNSAGRTHMPGDATVRSRSSRKAKRNTTSTVTASGSNVISARDSTLCRAAQIGRADGLARGELSGRTAVHDRADFEDVAPARGGEGLTGVLLNQQDRRSARVDVADHGKDRLHELGGEPERRFIEQQHARTRHHR